ncbi:TIGR02206 family membrane protein [Nocardioides euryhalodurans]|uniref:TIGR02206 family membrane protein n=1 Tax=Nocardioides euryhalodurans TaxID=2518370 RepID=A0A4P7GJN7_9ACTN|nr:TIGR02206 family membrane protein [Nocardioides euryhalodurans]QBR92248.1 TIGR02206 family membrane protein [Nocardioides euryhalodurans]
MVLPLAAAFTPYDASHVGALVVLVVGAVVLVVVGRRLRGRDPADRLGRAMAVAMLATTLPLQVLYFTPDYWNVQKTLPIQLCDLASFVSAYALWTHRRWAVGLTYYWGLTLTTQAILTPDLDSAFPDPIFLLFWGMHVGTVWAAIYLVWGRGVTPDWRTFRVAVLATAGWAAAVFTLNVLAGTNYGFLNRKPSAASALDLLGPWPWYVLLEIAIIVAAWALATWPWVRGGGGAG